MSTVTIARPVELWEQALEELQGQMTRAMFDTWLSGTVASADCSSGGLVINCKNTYAVEWLDNRLRPTIERTIAYIFGAPIEVAFTVSTESKITSRMVAVPEMAAVSASWIAPDFDPGDTRRVSGWFPISEYASCFWAPFLGTTAWRVWEIVRQADRRTAKSEWTPVLRYTVPQLAALVPCGTQALTGRTLRCDAGDPRAELVEIQPVGATEPVRASVIRMHGAFDRLQAEDVAQIERFGERKLTTYRISVRTSLPLLHPSQVTLLTADLQSAHEDWLRAHGLDPEHWL